MIEICKGGGASGNRTFELQHFCVDQEIFLKNFRPKYHPLKYAHILLYRLINRFPIKLFAKSFNTIFKKLPFTLQKQLMRYYFVESSLYDSIYIQCTKKLQANTFCFHHNAYIEGYFQNISFIEPISSILKHDFLLNKPLSPHNAILKHKIISTLDSVFLHIRRGDYLESKHWEFKSLGSAYYNNAIATIKYHIKNPHIFIFSNDMQWCKEHFIRSLDGDVRKNVVFAFIEGNSELNPTEEMELMRSCKNAIIANSTFSWWAAYLIENPSKIVCMPSQILLNPHRIPITKHLQCKGWIVINDIWRTRLEYPKNSKGFCSTIS